MRVRHFKFKLVRLFLRYVVSWIPIFIILYTKHLFHICGKLSNLYRLSQIGSHSYHLRPFGAHYPYFKATR